MEDPNFRLKIMLAIELPFWLNLRIGYYPIEYDEHVINQYVIGR